MEINGSVAEKAVVRRKEKHGVQNDQRRGNYACRTTKHAGENNQSGYQHHVRIGDFQKPGDSNQQDHAQKSYQ